MQAVNRESLSRIIDRVRATLRTQHVGGLIAAETVCELAKTWESYRSEAEGKDCTTFLRETLGKNLDWFARRATALQKVAEGDVRVARSFAGQASDSSVIWLAGQADAVPHLGAIRTEIRRVYRKAGDNPLSLPQVKRLTDRILGRVAKKAECQRCKELEAQLRALGVECSASSESEEGPTGGKSSTNE